MAYRISELAELVGLSRSTLLYYEKLGLIHGQRLHNGYRSYDERDVQRLRLIQQLQAGGLTLKECYACLHSKVERQVLRNRLQQLDKDIAKKQRSRRLLAALLGESDLREWHESIDKIAPDAHLEWLMQQGFTEKEALRLKWLSKDMNKHEQYMADFTAIFEKLERWGPGTEAETIKALELLPFFPEHILEIGCGNGIATAVLAKHSSAMITAVDNDEAALRRLADRLQTAGAGHRVGSRCASMTELPFTAANFDVIWAEGSAYIMGVTNALKEWKHFLKKDGVFVLSDLVWRTDTPSAEVQAFWQKEYPDMTTAAVREEQARAAGYRVLASFVLSEEAWKKYYDPLQKQVQALKATMADSKALNDIETELHMYRNYPDAFGYQMFVLVNSGQ